MTTEEENLLICERLLGWRICKGVIPAYVIRPENEEICGTAERPPKFDSWDEAGLILDALDRRSIARTVWQFHHNDSIGHSMTIQWGREDVTSRSGPTGPLAIRAAVLVWCSQQHSEQHSE